jgi:hypothetical protein
MMTRVPKTLYDMLGSCLMVKQDESRATSSLPNPLAMGVRIQVTDHRLISLLTGEWMLV